jgi:hypothetical protein
VDSVLVVKAHGNGAELYWDKPALFRPVDFAMAGPCPPITFPDEFDGGHSKVLSVETEQDEAGKVPAASMISIAESCFSQYFDRRIKPKRTKSQPV